MKLPLHLGRASSRAMDYTLIDTLVHTGKIQQRRVEDSSFTRPLFRFPQANSA